MTFGKLQQRFQPRTHLRYAHDYPDLWKPQVFRSCSDRVELVPVQDLNPYLQLIPVLLLLRLCKELKRRRSAGTTDLADLDL